MNGNLSFFNLLHEFRAMGEFAGFANSAWTLESGRTGQNGPNRFC